MTYLSLGEAAKAAGVAKGTLSKALKTGKLSYTEKTAAGYRIDPAELFRVFPRKQARTVEGERSETPVETGEVVALLKAEVADLRRRLDQSEAERREAQARVVGLLSDHRPKTERLWSRFFGQRPELRGRPE